MRLKSAGMNRYEILNFAILFKKTIFMVGWLSLFSFCAVSFKWPQANDQPVIEILNNHTFDKRVNEVAADSLIREVYVPIYSDIYNQPRDSRTLLTATLSIRNTSIGNGSFISKIDYYNTEGVLVRSYLDQTIYFDRRNLLTT